MPSVVEDRVACLPGLPAPVDIADVWLGHALAELLAACALPAAAAADLLEEGIRPVDVIAWPRAAEAARSDAALLAVGLAALAVEARLDRVLRLRDPGDWETVAHLAPLEKLRLAPRLLQDTEPAHAELLRRAAALYAVKDRLAAAPAPHETPFGSCRLVQSAARMVDLLAEAAGREEDASSARAVEHVAAALVPRARRLSHPHTEPASVHTYVLEQEFPPDVVGS